ncbi:Putative Rpf-interacting protein [Hoyosella subflava DQS3-9A1]|uniref:Putative Rpf-interacting protein n=1 Tax=Hoyosella subflava (strain DSM 45089 / JCM 17490 / NBRC 109087 / DQS3-9A1) TaxID=443218 RepID=F6EN95_HOYSD|nr:Putative Rpf-interacting protein [Hoyosella subflava DQS3-9A1]
MAGLLMATQSTVSLAIPPRPSDGEIADAQGAAANSVRTVSHLIDELATKEAELANLDAEIATVRQQANKALVDLEHAQNEATRAEDEASAARALLEEASQSIREAQERYDAFVHHNYVQGGPADSLELFAGALGPGEVLDRAHLRNVVGLSQKSAIEALERARAQMANQDSSARLARDQARTAASQAQTAREAAMAAFGTALERQQQAVGERERLARERTAAQALLQAARDAVEGLQGQRRAHDSWAAAAAQEPAAAEGNADAAGVAENPEITAPLEEFTPQENTDPIGPVDTTERIAAAPAGVPSTGSMDAARQEANLLADLDLGRLVDTILASGSMGSLESFTPPRAVPPSTPPPGSQNPPPSTGDPGGGDPIPSTRAQKIDAVVNRALSQVGVPYAWGGGNANGPTLGIRDGGVADRHGDYLKIGFDCSGLMVYTFAGVGISLPRFSGYIYNAGTKVPVAQMERGDMLFWGAGGSQHVSLYIGNGQMVEAPFSGATVRVVAVRWSGIQPFAVRMI